MYVYIYSTDRLTALDNCCPHFQFSA